jgi:hypothetical protein
VTAQDVQAAPVSGGIIVGAVAQALGISARGPDEEPIPIGDPDDDEGFDEDDDDEEEEEEDGDYDED